MALDPKSMVAACLPTSALNALGALLQQARRRTAHGVCLLLWDMCVAAGISERALMCRRLVNLSDDLGLEYKHWFEVAR